jgi:pyruvate ferredoxin oxidoreductase alpha subunit
MLDGNGAAVEALKLARVRVVAAYPITPQSPIAEKLAANAADGSMDASYMRIESEHSALSCTIGAQLTGVRAATATASVGLALMHEVLGVASGLRLPIVMPVVNRALVSPWSLWCDHQDSMAERDSGWLQFYAENAQEVLDMLLLAYRVAEHPEVLTPAMVCMDGFYVSHASQPVMVPDQEAVDELLPPYHALNLHLDPRNPMFINNLIPPEEFSEMRYQQKMGFERSLEVFTETSEKFEEIFGRKYGTIEAHQCEDADAVLVTLGSMSGTAKYVAKKLRQENLAVGVLKLNLFRPFPVAAIRKTLSGKIVAVLDRSAGLGAAGGPVWGEVSSALAGSNTQVFGYIGGLGGRDITESTLERIFLELLEIKAGRLAEPQRLWIDTDPQAMQLRPFEGRQAA